MMQESLARKLRVLRAERGITLQEAEELTGVTRETLGALEHGQRGAYTNTLQKIAEGYGITVGELLEEPVPLGKVPEAGSSEPTEWREYKEVKALDESRDRELAQRYLTQTPSDAERIKDLEGNTGVLEGYVQRWDVELEYLTEIGKYPYGKGIVFFFQAEDGIRDDLVTGVQTCALPISPSFAARPDGGAGLSLVAGGG